MTPTEKPVPVCEQHIDVFGFLRRFYNDLMNAIRKELDRMKQLFFKEWSGWMMNINSLMKHLYELIYKMKMVWL